MWDVWIHILGIWAECACWGRAARVYRSYKGGGGSLPPHPALRATFPPRGRLFGGTPSFAPKGEGFRAADSRPYREKSSGAGG